MKHLKNFNESSEYPTTIYVITDTESGWDCVRDCYRSLEDAVNSLGGEYIANKSVYDYRFDSYVIHMKELY